MSYIAVVDYGVGNLKSVSNAFAYLGIETKITGDPDELELAQAIVLPGRKTKGHRLGSVCGETGP